MNMIIQSIQNYNTNTNFRGWQHTVYKSDAAKRTIDNIKYTNNTWAMRDCSEVKNFINFVLKKYKDISKVNFYDYGCSNGLETYSYILTLIGQGGISNLKKFCPIMGKDINSYAISQAKANRYLFTPREISDVEVVTNNDIDVYFRTDHYPIDKFRNVYLSPRTLLTANVQFAQADILDDYKNIQPDNSIISARNFWPYLNLEDRKTLAKNLYNHLGMNTCIFTGKFDEADPFYDTPASKILIDTGFRPVPNLDYVYEKTNG